MSLLLFYLGCSKKNTAGFDAFFVFHPSWLDGQHALLPYSPFVTFLDELTAFLGLSSPLVLFSWAQGCSSEMADIVGWVTGHLVQAAGRGNASQYFTYNDDCHVHSTDNTNHDKNLN